MTAGVRAFEIHDLQTDALTVISITDDRSIDLIISRRSGSRKMDEGVKKSNVFISLLCSDHLPIMYRTFTFKAAEIFTGPDSQIMIT